MYSDNLRKLESYLSSLECPVHHCCTQVEFIQLDGHQTILRAVPSSRFCCQDWKDHIAELARYEMTCAENCAMTGTFYAPSAK